MRNLTVKQKKILDKFIADCKSTEMQRVIHQAPYYHPVRHEPMWSINVEDLPDEIYEQLMKINDTEILYQNVDRYLSDESTKD